MIKIKKHEIFESFNFLKIKSAFPDVKYSLVKFYLFQKPGTRNSFISEETVLFYSLAKNVCEFQSQIVEGGRSNAFSVLFLVIEYFMMSYYFVKERFNPR